MDLGAPVSYLVLEPGSHVVSADGEVVGTVAHVLAAEDEDVFDGIVIDCSAGPGGHRFADASDVAEIHERGCVLKVSAADVDRLPKPEANPAVMGVDPGDAPEGPLRAKLHRAWDLISGNY